MIKPSFLIAHRGLNTCYFENTRHALIAAAKYTDWIEVDVLLTQDDYCIIQHDDSLKPLFDLPLNVHTLDYDDIASLYDQRVGLHQLLTLPELLRLCSEYSLKLNLEIKSIEDDGVNHRLVNKIIECLKNTPKSHIILSSFNHTLLPRFKALGFNIALLFEQLNGAHVIEKLVFYDAVGIHCEDTSSGIDASLITRVHALGRYIAVYTVNSPQRVKWLKQSGIDAVFTDDVQQLSLLFNEPLSL